MANTIPNKGTKTSNFQSVGNEVDTNVWAAGISQIDCVLSGLAVTGSGATSVAVAKGAVLTNGVMKAVAANATFGTWTADATHPRIDLVVVDSSGTLQRRAGTAAALPLMPALTANDVVLAAIYIPANESPVAIVTADIVDKRMMKEVGTVTVYKTIAAETTDTTTTAIDILNKSGSGVVIPNAIFATAGKCLRGRIGGNIQVNNGAPVNLLVEFLWDSATAMYSATNAPTLDADRRAFLLEFDIMAQGTADQALVGTMTCSTMAAGVTNPTTGTGPGWGTAEAVWPFTGAGVADFSGTSDHTLHVRMKFDVSNSANQVVVEYATLELV